MLIDNSILRRDPGLLSIVLAAIRKLKTSDILDDVNRLEFDPAGNHGNSGTFETSFIIRVLTVYVEVRKLSRSGMVVFLPFSSRLSIENCQPSWPLIYVPNARFFYLSFTSNPWFTASDYV